MSDKQPPRRKSRRFQGSVGLLIGHGKTKEFVADIVDISVDGCFINTSQDAEDGEGVTLRIPTSTKPAKVIEFPGTVKPQSRDLKGFGIEFTAPLSEKQQNLLLGLVARFHEQADRRKKNR